MCERDIFSTFKDVISQQKCHILPQSIKEDKIIKIHK